MNGETNPANPGGVIWICGLSGVGKTTLAVEVARLLQEIHADVVRIDGDQFRRNFMPDASYTRDDRLTVARAISQYTWAQAQRGSLCVVATISLFTETHDSNRATARAHQLPFVQSLISAPDAVINARRAALMQSATHIVGTHIKAEWPDAPEHTFVNEGNVGALLAEAIVIRELWLSRWPLTERCGR
jgi:cytidine diphosphoramidate kinase